MTSAGLTDRRYRTAGEVERAVAGFQAGTLTHAEWDHRAHLTVVLDLVRAGNLRLNAVHWVPTTPTRGYHETITRFYMYMVGRYVEAEGRTGEWSERANRLIDQCGAPDLPLRHYSEARLWSAEARAGWVEPALLPLP